MARIRSFLILPFLFLVVSGCGAFSPQSYVESWVESEQSNLPKPINKQSKITQITAGEMEIVHTCEVTGLPDKRVIKDKNKIQKDAENRMTQNREQLKPLVDYKIKMTFIYQNAKKKELFRFTINPWEL